MEEFFCEYHKEKFKRVAGQLLIDLGYEKDYDWCSFNRSSDFSHIWNNP